MYRGLLIGVLAMFGGGLTSHHDAARYECLPKDVQLDEVVSYGRKPSNLEDQGAMEVLSLLPSACTLCHLELHPYCSESAT